ncbi:MAG: HAMP domain-containing protein, partial [Defluviitaleaceae bacterium]|nr:HAMP domain-containing protein [Defluviitaleaceae bacterium]
MFKKMKLASKLAVVISVLVLISLVALFLVSTIAIRPAIQNQSQEIVEAEAENMAYELDKWFYAFIHLTDAMAISLNQVPRSSMEDIVAAFRDNHPDITLTWIGFRDGHAYSGNRVAPPWSDAYNRPWYTNAVRAGGRSVINLPHFSAAEQVWVTSTSRLLPNIEGMEGAAALIITLDSVLETLFSFDIPGGGYAFILGPNGEIIAHPNSEHAPTDSLQNIADVDTYSDYSARILAGENFIRFTDADGVSSYLVPKVLPTSGWVMVSVIPTTVISGPVNQTITLVLIAVFILLVLLSGTIIFMIKRFLSPLDSLVDNVKNAADGNFNFNKASVSDDEIGIVAQNVSSFVDVIKTMIDDVIVFTKKNTEEGDYDYQMDINKYQGDFRELIERINGITKGSGEEARIALMAMEAIGNGDFDVQVKTLPGKRAYTNETINVLLGTLKQFSADVNLMIKATSEKGDLSFRIDAENYKGDWSKIAYGLNDIAKAVD